jgi:hypothetical protein
VNRERSSSDGPGGDVAAYEAGLRAGYAHGYEVGLAHGHAQIDVEPAAAMTSGARVRLDGPTRDELIARGHIPIDHTRPPALPVRLWQAEDWAKADHRDLPTTDDGRAGWRAAIAAGRVPEPLAAEFAEAVSHAVAEADRAVAKVRARIDAPAPVTARAVSAAPSAVDERERDEVIAR